MEEIPVTFNGRLEGGAELGTSVARFIYHVSHEVGIGIDEGKLKPLERFNIIETDSLGEPSKIVITGLDIVSAGSASV